MRLHPYDLMTTQRSHSLILSLWGLKTSAYELGWGIFNLLHGIQQIHQHPLYIRTPRSREAITTTHTVEQSQHSRH